MKIVFPLLIVFVYSFLSSCKNDEKANDSTYYENIEVLNDDHKPFEEDTVLSLYSANITLPKGWRLANDDTFPKVADATSRYRFHNKREKLIHLEYGLNTNGNPAEPNVIPYIFRKGYVANNADTTGLIFTDNPRLLELRKNGNYLVSTDSISNFKATFFKPKKKGQGYFSMYIDSIGVIAGNIEDLVLFGENLDEFETKELEKIAHSLIIKKRR